MSNGRKTRREKKRLDALAAQAVENGRMLSELHVKVRELEEAQKKPIPELLWCPGCGARHIDVGEFATRSHHTHACQVCGVVWRPAIVATVGVQFLPGFKNEAP